MRKKKVKKLMITENMFLNTHYVLLIFHAIFDMQQNDIEKNNPPPPPPQPSTLCLIARHQVLGFLRRPHPPTLTPHPHPPPPTQPRTTTRKSRACRENSCQRGRFSTPAILRHRKYISHHLETDVVLHGTCINICLLKKKKLGTPV